MEKTFIEWLQHFNFKPNLYDRYHKDMIDKVENEPKLNINELLLVEKNSELYYKFGSIGSYCK